SGFRTENKFGMREDELEPLLDAGFKITGLAAYVVEAHQGRDIRLHQRPAIRLSRHSAENGAGAFRLLTFGSGRRRTRQDLVAARCFPCSHTVDWTLNGDLTHLRRLHDAFDRIVVENAAPVRMIQ